MAQADYKIKAMPTEASQWTIEEIYWVSQFQKNLRPADRREAAAAHFSVEGVIMDSIFASEEAYRVSDSHGEPLVLFGKCREQDMPGRLIWCLATNALAPYEIAFARVSKRILREWADKYGILWNAVGDFNRPAKRWLKWCGAEFGEPVMMNGERFVKFYIKGGKKNV